MPHHASTKPDCLPLIAVLATGGTVAGRTENPGSGTKYTPGVLDAAAVLASAPGLDGAARLRCRRVAAIGSEDMTPEVWLDLARAVAAERADPEVAGVVVLHGTDTMEETAVFLDAFADSPKPVILTGAMRPADAVAADGPANILAAVRTAACPDAAGRGVLVVMNDAIHRARQVRKGHTSNLAAFSSWGGPEGGQVDGKPVFFRPPGDAFTPLRLDGVQALPRVEIIYGHAGQERALVDAALAAGAWGIVHAGVGMGNIHAAVRPALAEAAAGGVAVVAASRVADGPVPATDALRRDNIIAAGFLNPQKARAFLTAALTRASIRPRELQIWFDSYGWS